MRLLVGNVTTEVIIGGKDNLLSFDLHKELDLYLSEKVPGSFWQSKNNGGKSNWDGRHHFLKSNKFPTGFLPSVIKFCNANEVDITLEDKRNNVVTFKEEFTHKINDLELRDYQIEVAQKTIYNNLETGNVINRGDGSRYLESIAFPRGIVNNATNTGKTAVMAGILANIENPKALFIIHSAEIYNDAVEYFSQFFKVGQINSKNYDIQDVTVVMVKSLYNRAKKSINVYNDLKRFNTVLVDEGHRAGGKEYAEILRHVDAYVRVFLSGTALGNSDKIKNLHVVAGSGPILSTIKNSEMIAIGVSRKPLVYLHRITHKKKKLCFSYEEDKEAFLNNSQERADKVRQIIQSDPSKSTLIAFINYKAGERVYNTINDLGATDMVDGKSKNRKQRIADFLNGITRYLVGSTIFKEGLNLPNIQRLIMYTGGVSIITILQFVGRALRANGEKTVEIHDFIDEDSEHLAKHSRKRINIYRDEGFEVKEIEYNEEGLPVVIKVYPPKKVKKV